MNLKKLTGIATIIFALVMGCSGKYGNFKTQSASDSKVTQQELFDNWSDYDIWLNYRPKVYRPYGLAVAVIVFDPKNDDTEILVVGNNWSRVKDQETWTEIVKTNPTSQDDFDLSASWFTDPITSGREIWGPDNQLYGFFINQKGSEDWIILKLVDENTMQLSWQKGWFGAGGGGR